LPSSGYHVHISDTSKKLFKKGLTLSFSHMDQANKG
jgi:hypothetical protein